MTPASLLWVRSTLPAGNPYTEETKIIAWNALVHPLVAAMVDAYWSLRHHYLAAGEYAKTRLIRAKRIADFGCTIANENGSGNCSKTTLANSRRALYGRIFMFQGYGFGLKKPLKLHEETLWLPHR